MKYIGIDYGEKNIGLAISDSLGKVSMPYDIIINSNNFIEKFINILEKEKIDEIVIGKSLNQKGEENKINNKINFFSKQIPEKYKIHFINEIYTSMESKWGIEKKIRRDWKKNKKKKNIEKIDDKAATMILKTFLEKKKKKF